MRTTPLRRILPALALAMLGAGGALGAQDTRRHPFQGVTYIDRTETSPRSVHMHIVQIDLAAPGIRFKLSPPAGPQEVVRQTTLDYLKQEHAQVAINAHFFWPWPSTVAASSVIGIAASDGTVYSAFEAPVQNYALVADAPGINIDAANRAGVVHRDPAVPDGRHVREPVVLWNTLAGSAQIVTDGAVTVPVYRDAGHPQALLPPQRAQDARRGPLLTPGGPGQYSNARSWYDVATARTAVGLSRDNRTLTLFTADRAGDSRGLTVGEVAAMLAGEYGVWNALNLDGGGSTSIAMEDPVTHVPSLVNTSSDNPAGRAVGSSLAVFAASPR